MDATFLSFEHDQYTTDETYDRAAKSHVSRITRFFNDETPAIVANAPQLLEVVHPTNHSISHIAILNTLKHIDEASRPISPDAFREYVLQFLLSFDARQIRYVGDVLYDLVKDVVQCKFFPARQAIDIVALVLKRLDPESAMLTSIHIAVVKLAYETDNLDQVLPIIEKPWVFLPGMKNENQPKYLCDMTASPASYINTTTQLTEAVSREDAMQYEWQCALIFTSKMRWADAHKAYQRIISWPARDGIASKIMTDAHRRWILTGLLALGQTPSLPSYITATTNKTLSALSKSYTDVAALFSTTNVQRFREEVEKGTEIWNTDQTATLVEEVVKAYQKWQILGLADVYQKISVPEIRQQTLSAETANNLETDQGVEELLQEMISSGMLLGLLAPGPDGINCLTFLPCDAEIEHAEFQKKIQGDARIKTLNKWAQATDARLAASKDYAKHIIREQKRQDKDGSSHQDRYGYDPSVEDEDLMTGIQHP